MKGKWIRKICTNTRVLRQKGNLPSLAIFCIQPLIYSKQEYCKNRQQVDQGALHPQQHKNLFPTKLTLKNWSSDKSPSSNSSVSINKSISLFDKHFINGDVGPSVVSSSFFSDDNKSKSIIDIFPHTTIKFENIHSIIPPRM